jgi:glycerophosphoryl diester phosphodiesterase
MSVASRTTPFNIGHRGASGDAPENTIPAFTLAFTQGANGFETDLRTTKDGVIVLIHDDTVDRTTNCSSTAPEGQCRCGPVNALTLAAIKYVFDHSAL